MPMKTTVKAVLAAVLLSPAGLYAFQLTPLDDPMTAPAIEAPDLSGDLHSISDFAGKVVVVNFWATWCPPCVKELSSMQSLRERFRNRPFAMVAVNVGEGLETVKTFLDDFETRIDFIVLLDEELVVTKRWPVFGLPTSFVIDSDGSVVYKALGERDWTEAEIIETIERMLGADDAVTGNGMSVVRSKVAKKVVDRG